MRSEKCMCVLRTRRVCVKTLFVSLFRFGRSLFGAMVCICHHAGGNQGLLYTRTSSHPFLTLCSVSLDRAFIPTLFPCCVGVVVEIHCCEFVACGSPLCKLVYTCVWIENHCQSTHAQSLSRHSVTNSSLRMRSAWD